MVGLGLGTFLVVNDPVVVGAFDAIADRGNVRSLVIVPHLEQHSQDLQTEGSAGAARNLLASLTLREVLLFIQRGLRPALRASCGDFVGRVLSLVHYDLARLSRLKPSVAFLHPTLTDLAVAFGLTGLLDGFRRLGLSWRLPVGLMTANLPSTLGALSAIQLDVAWVAGPVNRKGYQMRPDRASCERVIQETSVAVMATHITDTIPPTMEDLMYLKSVGISTFLVELRHAADSMRLLAGVGEIFGEVPTAPPQCEVGSPPI
jgi:hypothetical protein